MFELFKSDASGKFHFRLKAGNGEITLSSEAYDTKASAENGIASVKTNAPIPERFAIKQLGNGKWHFVLKAGNGQVIGQSQQYASESGAKDGIASVTKSAAGEVNDLTA